MIISDDNIYFKGKALISADTDWDEMAKRLTFLARRVSGLTFIPYRAVADADGTTCWLPFAGQDIVHARRVEAGSEARGARGNPGPFDMEARRRTAREQQMASLTDDLEEWIGGAVEIEFKSPSAADPESIDLVNEVSGAGRRASFFTPPKPIEAEDIRPYQIVSGPDPIEELDAMIGLEEVKRQVHKIVNMIEKSDRKELPVLHSVFLGNPGTGKTTVARIIARIFKKMGVTGEDGVFVEAAREDLVGIFVGQTAPKTKAVCEKARGGTLFIDEAYSLGMYSGRTSIDYGAEAIATLVKEMENHKNDPVMIFAGYTDQMEQMIDVNPGMRDRIGFYFTFPDYSAEELSLVFRKFAEDDGYILSPAAQSQMEETFAAIEKNKDENFANGRIVRKVYERVKLNHMIEYGTGDTEIRQDDFLAAFEDRDLAELAGYHSPQRFAMGFA